MSGEVCVVTGATSGIGQATAAALAGRGAQVVLVSRDRGRGEAAAAELAAAGGPAPRLEVADLASMGQVRTLADRLGALERIDVLINNAGLMAGQRRVTADGFDEVFAVNHLAPFLLTNLLLGKLAVAGPARVITVTSDAHTAARLDLDDLQLERGWQSWRAYANSKLANILFTRELGPQARRQRGDRQLRAPRAGTDPVRPRGPAAHARRRDPRAAVHAVTAARRSHGRLPGNLPSGGGRNRRLLRQKPAARAVTGRPRRRRRTQAVAAQRGTHRPHPGPPPREMTGPRSRPAVLDFPRWR
jgi:NAD(P)-dependent dehydrogenase (short-subunit alcohol dehydrogenase family)